MQAILCVVVLKLSPLRNSVIVPKVSFSWLQNLHMRLNYSTGSISRTVMTWHHWVKGFLDLSQWPWRRVPSWKLWCLVDIGYGLTQGRMDTVRSDFLCMKEYQLKLMEGTGQVLTCPMTLWPYPAIGLILMLYIKDKLRYKIKANK